MTKDMLELRKKVRRKKPLIHCITNPISIHACANAVLALGARPIMAEHPKEVAQITATAGALMLNLGNITDVRMESMEISLRTAKENDIPVLLDLVGTACSDLRFRYAKHLMEIGGIAVLKGNTSELLSIADCPSHSIGVDAGEKDAVTSQNQREMANIFGQLSKETGAVILASGKKDMVVSSSSVYVLSNGDSMLACITGTGCMQGAVCTAYLAGRNPILACILAAASMGIAGELAAEKCHGPGSFQIEFLDQLYGMSDLELQNRIRIEQI